MKNLNLCLTMALIAIAPAHQLLSSASNIDSIGAAPTATLDSNSQSMRLTPEFSSAVTSDPVADSIDNDKVATPPAPTPVKNATLLTDNSAPQQAMPDEQPAQNIGVALAPSEQTVPAPVVTETEQAQVAPVSQQAAQESQTAVAPATNQEPVAQVIPSQEENCAWSNMGNCVKSALVAMYTAACNGVMAVKNMIW